MAEAIKKRLGGEDALELWKRLDQAGMTVSVGRYGYVVHKVRTPDERQQGLGGKTEERGYEVEVDLSSLQTPAHLRLLADQVEKYDAMLVPTVTSIRVR